LFSTGSRQLLIAVLMAAAGGCRTVKNQIKALTGRDTTATTASADNPGNGPHFQSGGYIKGPTPVLDQTFRVRHDPSEVSRTRGLRVPTFDWQRHGDRTGGAFSGGSGTRHGPGS
jgi:hypothetical protein